VLARDVASNLLTCGVSSLDLRPLLAGRRARRRWRRFLRFPRHHWRPRRLGRRRFGRRRPPFHVYILRISVSERLAAGLTGAARFTLALATVASLLLLLSAFGLHRGARRAQRVERELRRRETLSSLGEMAAVLAHEIRTPLASMKGNAQLLGERTPDDDRTRAIVSEAERLERLVNGMLDYARDDLSSPSSSGVVGFSLELDF